MKPRSRLSAATTTRRRVLWSSIPLLLHPSDARASQAPMSGRFAAASRPDAERLPGRHGERSSSAMAQASRSAPAASSARLVPRECARQPAGSIRLKHKAAPGAADTAGRAGRSCVLGGALAGYRRSAPSRRRERDRSGARRLASGATAIARRGAAEASRLADYGPCRHPGRGRSRRMAALPKQHLRQHMDSARSAEVARSKASRPPRRSATGSVSARPQERGGCPFS